MIGPKVKFNNGKEFPIFGLGTWQSKKEDVQRAVRTALDAGYRHIDTAFMYFNEEEIGEVLQEYFKAGKLKREDLFITTKLWSTYFEPSKVEECMDISLKRLKLDYVDLYLAHNPMAFEDTGSEGIIPMRADGTPAIVNIPVEDTWAAMEKLVANGKAKSIGVSNYNSKQIDRICAKAKVKPVTNQVELNAYFGQFELQTACAKHDILLTSYASIGSPGRPDYIKDKNAANILDDPVIQKLAQKYNKTTAQILLRQLTQRNILIIPKSVTPKRILENSQIFDFQLTPDEVKQVNALDKNLRVFVIPGLEAHPEYPY